MNSVRTALTPAVIPTDYTITGWIMRGVIREDDNTSETRSSDEPGGVFNRVYGHFYNPITGAGLSALGVNLGASAPTWLLTPDAQANGRKNIYNIPNAREAMYRALTGKTKDGQDAKPANTGSSITGEDVRKAYWATTFRTLGDAVHLLQDMGQPQHTRIDTHSGYGCLPPLGCLFGHDSFYEKYMSARTLQSGSFVIEEGVGSSGPITTVETVASQLVYTGYPVKPAFNSYADFFSTAIGGGSASGRGLANYSNGRFYTAGTNIGSLATNQYTSPHPQGIGLVEDKVSSMSVNNMGGVSMPSGSTITFLTGDVKDNYTGTIDPKIKLSTYGAWDEFLRKKNPLWSSYTLNYYNYDDMARLLVPRAVAYSAGLIDYFFRGKMEISLPDTGVYGLIDHAKFAPGGPNYPTDPVAGTKGFDKIKLKLKNTTDPINTTPQSMTQGTLVAILKFHRNTCYKDDLSGELNNQSPLAAQVAACRSENEDIAVSDPLPPRAVPAADTAPDGVELTFTFSGKQMPMNAWDVSLQVVYRGKLGSEDDAVAVATKDISEPTHVVFFSPFGWESKWSVLNLEPPVYPGYSAKFKLSFGPSQTPVTIQPPTEKSNLLVSPYFSRFAMLQDLAKPVEFTVACNCFSNSPFVEFLRPYVAQQGKPYEAMESTAGIAWWGINLPYTVTRAYIGGTPPAAPNADDVKHVPALPDWARYPVPVEISGW